MLGVKTIVVGYDGTKHSSRALERALALAQTFGSSLVIVSVGDALLAAAAAAGMGVGPVAVAPIGAEDFELAQKQLRAAGEAIAGSGVEAEYVAEIGVPSERIVAVADERHAELIVVGHARGRLPRAPARGQRQPGRLPPRPLPRARRPLRTRDAPR